MSKVILQFPPFNKLICWKNKGIDQPIFANSNIFEKVFFLLQISNMEVEREKALEHKQRMLRMREDKESFLAKITAARSFIYEVWWRSRQSFPFY